MIFISTINEKEPLTIKNNNKKKFLKSDKYIYTNIYTIKMKY